MKSTATAAIDTTVNAWEHYCSGDFDRLEDLHNESPSDAVSDLAAIAKITRNRRADVAPTGKSLFSALAEGMIAYYKKDFAKASEKLGTWLSEKNYYSVSILETFGNSAVKAKQYTNLYRISKKFLGIKGYTRTSAEYLFYALFYTGKHAEALVIFEKYNELLNSENIIQKAAFSMIQTNRFSDAKRILVSLYERITGAKYEMDYESVRKKYEKSVEAIPQLKAVKNPSFEQSMELGMAYLFSEKYGEAMNVFRTLEKDRK